MIFGDMNTITPNNHKEEIAKWRTQCNKLARQLRDAQMQIADLQAQLEQALKPRSRSANLLYATFAQAAKQFSIHIQRRCSRKRSQAVELTLSRCGVPDATPMLSVTAEQIADYLNRFHHPRTYNFERSIVSSFFTFCKRKGWVEHNVMDSVYSMRAQPTDPEIITAEQLRSILTSAVRQDPQIVPYLAARAFGGLRTSEVMSVTSKYVRGGFIMLGSSITKTSKRRAVPLHPTLEKWLQLFPFPDVSPQERNIKYRMSIFTKGLPANALRHTAASAMIASGVSASQVAEILGNSETTLRSHYLGLMTDAEAESWFAVTPEEVLP